MPPKKIHSLSPAQAAEYRRKAAEEDARIPESRARMKKHVARHEFMLAEFREIFERLRTEREKQGLSLADVQKLTGMSRAAISRLENRGEPNFNVKTVLRYADALGLKVRVAISN